MTDIVERLRRLAERERPYGSLPDTLDEAAKEIERLREWNREIAINAKEFAETLREIADFDTDEDISNEECMRDIARAALEGK